MNKQFEIRDSQRVATGIEWCDWTWNVMTGCQHACVWTVGDGAEARCYAESMAESAALRPHYPHGFAHHYWHPQRLEEPLRLKTPAKIFADSMADAMGRWVPDEHLHAVLDVAGRAHQHTFQFLTKNAPRLVRVADRLPPNAWVGVSAPPTRMLGQLLEPHQQERMVKRQLEALAQVNVPVRWMSIEPLSFDIAPLLDVPDLPLNWAVIGAATDGRRAYQPAQAWVDRLLALFDERGIPVFFKGNLVQSVWRADFPRVEPVPPPTQQLTMF